jgi:predicted ATPase
MPVKDTKIEFRCPNTMRQSLLDLRPALGTKTVSDTARKILRGALEGFDTHHPWHDLQSFREMALHLDRIASAAQKARLEGGPIADAVADLPALVHKVKELLDGVGRCRRAKDPCN